MTGPRSGNLGVALPQMLAESKLVLTETSSPPQLAFHYLAFRLLRPLASASGSPGLLPLAWPLLLRIDTQDGVVALVLRVANTEVSLKRNRELPRVFTRGHTTEGQHILGATRASIILGERCLPV